MAVGAKIAVGGTLEEADRTIHPTLLTEVTPDMLIMQEEIFGPIVPVLTYKNIDDVIAYISSRPKPLALYIYSNSQYNIEKLLSRTSSGGVTINGFFSHYLENQLPFGGVNQSGMGSYHGVFGFRTFSHERAVYIQENTWVSLTVCTPSGAWPPWPARSGADPRIQLPIRFLTGRSPLRADATRGSGQRSDGSHPAIRHPRQGRLCSGPWQEGEGFHHGWYLDVRWKEQGCLWWVAGAGVLVKAAVAEVCRGLPPAV